MKPLLLCHLLRPRLYTPERWFAILERRLDVLTPGKWFVGLENVQLDQACRRVPVGVKACLVGV